MEALLTKHTRQLIWHKAVFEVWSDGNDHHSGRGFISFACRKDTRVPHEIQERQEVPLLGPFHPVGAVTDENVSQSFCGHAWHAFVSNGTPGMVR